MTKRILALVVAVIMLVAALASCTPTVETKTPAKTTSAPKTTESKKTEAPITTPASVDTTPATSGQPTTDPNTEEEDIWAQFGGIDKMVPGDVYGKAFEVWPFEGNEQWAPRAFLQGTLCVNKEDYDASEGVGTPDYQYSFVFWYADITGEDDAWKGPYTTTCETVYNALPNGNIIYRPLVGSCAEGNLLTAFEVDHEYMLVMQIVKGEEVQVFATYNITWEEQLFEMVGLYNDFWTAHNRADGYTANDGVTVTASDTANAQSHGFSAKGEWVGKNS